MDPYGKMTTGALDPDAWRAVLERAQYLAERDNKRQSIWRTPDGEYRIRPYGETVNPTWRLVQQYHDEPPRK